MKIKIECPSCGWSTETKNENLGKKAKCGQCSKLFTIKEKQVPIKTYEVEKKPKVSLQKIAIISIFTFIIGFAGLAYILFSDENPDESGALKAMKEYYDNVNKGNWKANWKRQNCYYFTYLGGEKNLKLAISKGWNISYADYSIAMSNAYSPYKVEVVETIAYEPANIEKNWGAMVTAKIKLIGKNKTTYSTAVWHYKIRAGKWFCGDIEAINYLYSAKKPETNKYLIKNVTVLEHNKNQNSIFTEISGIVQNSSLINVKGVFVEATIYDSKGKFLGVEKKSCTPLNLKGAEKGTFKMLIDKDKYPRKFTYKLKCTFY